MKDLQASIGRLQAFNQRTTADNAIVASGTVDNPAESPHEGNAENPYAIRAKERKAQHEKEFGEDFDEAAVSWASDNGFIPPYIIEKIRESAIQLDENFRELRIYYTVDGGKIKEESFDLIRAISRRSIRHIAYCNVYNFVGYISDKFIGLLEKCGNIPNFSLNDFKSAIRRAESDIRKEYKQAKKNNAEHLEKEENEYNKSKWTEYRREVIQKLNRLKQDKSSVSNNFERVKLLNEILDWITTGKKDEKEKIAVKSNQDNADLIFTYDPLVDGLIGYNEFTRQEVFLKPTYWTKNFNNNQWTDADDSQLYSYLRRTYKDIHCDNVIKDAMITYSRKNAFHPIKQYLEGLQWDGVHRAETFFVKFLKVADNAYTREITRKWLLGAVSRIYNEGCEFQYVLVLQGEQGCGKSFCAKKLGVKWHISLADSLDDSHATDTIQLGWIVELEELSAGRKAEINAQKGFLSRNIDSRRAAYARRAENVPRHCVFIATVNDKQFLRDFTGNRRYKILVCHTKKNEIAEKLTDDYVDQIWAEIMTEYRREFVDGFNHEKLRISDNNEIIGESIAENFIQDDGLAGEIKAFLDIRIPPNFIWQFLTKIERREFFKTSSAKINQVDLNARIRATGKRNTQEIIDKIDNYIRQNNSIENSAVRVESYKGGAGENIQTLYFYGNSQRENTCAAEIFNEWSENDKRKSMARINEVLTQLDGWQQINKQEKNFAQVYGNQKKIFSRIHTDD